MTGGTETGRDERKQLAARRVQQTDTSGWAAAGKKKELVDVEVTLLTLTLTLIEPALIPCYLWIR